MWVESTPRTAALRRNRLNAGPSARPVDSVFHMHEITKVYQMGNATLQALRGVILDLMPGEFVVIGTVGLDT